MDQRKQRASSRHPHIEKIARNISKEAFRNKRQKIIDFLFCKNSVK
jgi:hypothetical protein